MNITIRQESPQDYPQVTRVNDLAFGCTDEGILVETIRKNKEFIPELSIVAEKEHEVIGHILFFPIEIGSKDKSFPSISLAPMSVIPKYQKQGIGGQLIKYGLEQCKKLGFRSVVVVGHPTYYPKFGFKRASAWNIFPPIDVPDEGCMAIELEKDALKNVSGVIQFPAEYEVAL